MPNTYTIELNEDELEMVLNALSYEHAENKELTADYRADLEALFELLDRVGQPWEGTPFADDPKQG